MVRDQHIMGNAGAVALNILAVGFAFDVLGVVDRLNCFNKVTMMYHDYLKRMESEGGT